MSMRLKGMLMNHLHAQLEQHLFDNAMVLQDVPCEMTFRTAQGYMEYENEQHSYLPLFHLIGSIAEIRGDFPFHVSSLYFDDADKPYLTKDILYYPNPDELAHMIKVGQFYTKNFAIPKILDSQEYSFPARVNLTIIPPPNPAGYEMATYGGDFVAETDEEKLNLPIIYVQMAGTGVTRKTDKLLDYYGIDFEEDMEIYPLTAESSGYVDPPLMMYMQEPQSLSVETTRENVKEMYISKEEEAQLIREQKAKESQAVVEPQVTDDYQMASPEDILLAQAERRIEQRVNERVKQNMLERQAQSEPIVEQEVQKESEAELSSESQKDDMLDFLNNTKNGDFIFIDPKSEVLPEQTHSDNDFIKTDEDGFIKEDEPLSETVQDDIATEVVEKQSENFIEDTMATEVAQPDMPQQQAEVKMDFNPEQNAFVEQERKEESSDGLVDEESDRVDLENMQGADVDDASLQAKLDEAHAKDVARGVAVSIQDDIVDQDEMIEKAENDNAAGSKTEVKSNIDSRISSQNDTSNTKRNVPSDISEIADKYDATRDANMDNNPSEYQ